MSFKTNYYIVFVVFHLLFLKNCNSIQNVPPEQDQLASHFQSIFEEFKIKMIAEKSANFADDTLGESFIFFKAMRLLILCV